ncbi:hypothetical protein HZS_7574 [Henneguya salminicola]|nr:hypothetical protein HZS_7574 [Henneguya salminicola]
MILSQNTGIITRKEFVGAEGIHTNHIESSWHALKLFLPRTSICYFNIVLGTQKHMHDGYFAEYTLKRKIIIIH